MKKKAYIGRIYKDQNDLLKLYSIVSQEGIGRKDAEKLVKAFLDTCIEVVGSGEVLDLGFCTIWNYTNRGNCIRYRLSDDMHKKFDEWHNGGRKTKQKYKAHDWSYEKDFDYD